jgi:KilA-N domain
MKTVQVMHRPMGQFEVLQRTSDGFFNATSLLKAWNEFKGMDKKFDHYTSLKSTKEFMETLENEEDVNSRNHGVLKSTRGKYGATWMHPYLFIDFAMWLNPSFKLNVIKFVYDQLIQFRHDAGDAYKEMCEALSKIGATKEDYASIARQLNVTCFDKHGKELRQNAVQSQLKELWILESTITTNINMGLIKDIAGVKVFIVNYLINKKTV